MKKLSIFILTFVIICLTVVLPSFAYTTAPTQELQNVYIIQPRPNSLYKPFPIKYSTITPTDGSVYPIPKDPSLTGFLYNMWGEDYSRNILYNGGAWRYVLSTDVYIKIVSDIGTSTMTVTLHNNSDQVYTICSLMFDQGIAPDFTFFVAEDQNIYLGTFYSSTQFNSLKKLDVPLWGNIVIPGDYDLETWYEAGYQNGFDTGYEEGMTDTNENAYNLGYLAGQDSNGIVVGAVDGFFNAITDFFYPFLSIGVGNLTLFTILGLIVIAGGVMIIIKIIRG